MGNAISTRRSNFMTPHERKKALRSLELYIEGRPWSQIKPLGGYSWGEFGRMLSKYPDLGKAYQEARRTSAHSFEDKALELAGELTGPNEFSGTQVRAHEVAMNQYRWSASRRNPAEYAETGANKLSLIVPIQINSSLNLAEPGAVEHQTIPDAYQFASEVLAAEPQEAPPATDSDPEVENHPTDPETLPAATGEALAAQLGLPEEVKISIPKRPSPGRPRKGHKTAQRTSISRTNMLKKAKKNPTVARALGLTKEDGSDGGSSTGG